MTEKVKQFIQQEILAASKSVEGIIKIFLDTKYWVYIREAHLGTTNSAIHEKILGELKRLANQKKAICAVAEDSLLEIAKNKSENAFRSTILN
ncbi:MAG: hypothetical protein IPO40_22305 [Fibrobacteres bacterium]|nr:hypothetical protein [Fibrobacterota bacterium]